MPHSPDDRTHMFDRVAAAKMIADGRPGHELAAFMAIFHPEYSLDKLTDGVPFPHFVNELNRRERR